MQRYRILRGARSSAQRVRRGGAAGLLAALALLAPGCEHDQVLHARWTGLEEGRVVQALTEPTGELSQLEDEEVRRAIEERIPGLIETARFMGRTMGVMADIAATDYSEEESRLPEVEQAPAENDDTVWGTSLYTKLACPGDWEEPIWDFSAGEMRLESPQLEGLELLPLLDGGEFLMSFDACQIGDAQLDAEIPGRYLLDFSRAGFVVPADPNDVPIYAVALDVGTVNVEGSASPLGVVAFGCGGQRSCQEDYRVSAEVLTANGTFVLAFRLLRSYWSTRSDLVMTVRGADGETDCVYTAGIGTTLFSCASE